MSMCLSEFFFKFTFNTFKIEIILNIFICVFIQVHMYIDTTGHLLGICSLFLLHGFQGLNSDWQAWWKGPLTTESSGEPLT